MKGPVNAPLDERLRATAGAERPRVTVIRAGGLGDSLLVLPAIRLIREVLPGAWVNWVGSHWAEALRPLVPFPMEVVRFDSPSLAGLFAPDAGLDPVGIFSDSDAIVLYTGSPEEDLARNAARLCPGPVIIWPAMPPAGIRAAVHYARAVTGGAAGTPALPASPVLAVPAELRLWGRSWVDGRLGLGAAPVAVHPGSGGRRKCWPAVRFAEVAGRLGRPLVALEGPADADAVKAFLSHVPHGVAVARASEMTLPQAAALIACCEALLGNDSGMSHLAAALGIPTVAVFGPTDPATWAPDGPRARVVDGPSTGAWPEAGAVLEAVRTLVPATTE
jgi:hypothetical protein